MGTDPIGALEVLLAVSTDCSIVGRHTPGERAIGITAAIGKELTGPTSALGTDGLFYIATVLIGLTLGTLNAEATGPTKWGIAPTARMVIEPAVQTLAFGTKAITTIVIAATGCTLATELTHNAEFGIAKTALVGVWVTEAAITPHTEGVKIITIIIAPTGPTIEHTLVIF